MPTINDPAHIALGTGDTQIVAEVGASTQKRVYILIVNTDNMDRDFFIHRYDSGSAESALQTNAILWNRKIAALGEELIEISTTLTTGWKISGRASVANVVIVHVDEITA